MCEAGSFAPLDWEGPGREAGSFAYGEEQMNRSPRHPVNGNGAVAVIDDRLLHYKKELHKQLIGGMNLAAIGTMSEDELRHEVRQAAEELCRLSSDLLSLSDRERLVNEVMDETFGLGGCIGWFPANNILKQPQGLLITHHGAGRVS